MTEFITQFHFIRPWGLLLFIVPAIFYFRYFSGLKSKSSWEKICDKHLLQFLIIKNSSQSRKRLGNIILSALTISSLAIAGPTWKEKQIPNLTPENPTVLLLSLSSDMMQSDIKPNRLFHAKLKAKALLEQLSNHQTGIIVYSDEPYMITPITDDINISINIIDSISTDIMPSNGDRVDRAIYMAVERLQDNGYRSGNIILFSSDAAQQFDKAIQSAKTALKSDFKIHALNISLTNNDKLKTIVQNGGGYYASISPKSDDIDYITSHIIADFSTLLKASNNHTTQWIEYGYWLSFLILPLFIYAFRRGIFIIALILCSSTAYAGVFTNNNQDALILFNDNNFADAVNKFDSTDWIGASYYRLQDYEKSLEEFSKNSDITSIYNQGNALAKLGRLEEAIEKYEEVLEKEPQHEDAAFNLEYLKQQQQEQQNSSSDSDDEDNEDENQDNNESSSDGNDSEDSDSEENDNADNNQEQEDNGADENSDNNNQKEQEQQQASAQEQDNSGDEEIANQTTSDENADQEDQEAETVEQQYREIPENLGGLLRAFIAREHKQNRYKE